VAEQTQREKVLQVSVKHVLLYPEPVQYREFNMFGYVYCDLNN